MQTIQDLKSLWDSEDPNSIELKLLLDWLIANRTLRMEEPETQLFPLLVANGVIHKDGITIGGGKAYVIKTSDPFSFGLYTHLVSFLGYAPIADVDALNLFIDSTEEQLLAPETRHGIAHCIKDIISIVIRIFDARGEVEQFCLSLKETTHRINLYCNGIFDFITTAKLQNSIRWNCIRHIALIVGENTTTRSYWNHLGQMVEKFASQSGDDGLALLLAAEKEIEKISIRDIYAQIFFGLIRAGKKDISELIALLTNDEKQDIAILVLSWSKLENCEDVIQILNLIDTFVNPPKTTQLQLPRLYMSILNKLYANRIDIYNRCFQNLDLLLSSSDIEIRNTTLTMIFFTDGHDEDLANIVIKRILENRPDNIELASLHTFFEHHTSVKPYFNCVRIIATKLSLRFNESLLQQVAWGVREKSMIEFDLELVNLLSANEGNFRWAGHKILHEIIQHFRGFRFANDILLLNDVQQYKLVMSLLDYTLMQPEQIVPLIVPLFNTKSEIVKEFVISKLEQLCEDYGQHIQDAIQLGLSTLSDKHVDICNRIEDYLQNMRSKRRAKVAIKELDPNYNQGNLIRAYLKAHNRVSKRAMSEGMKKGSAFLQMFKSVDVARGGGWKMGNMNDVQKLGEISVEMPIPRSIFIYPERNDLEFSKSFRENWSNLFR